MAGDSTVQNGPQRATGHARSGGAGVSMDGAADDATGGPVPAYPADHPLASGPLRGGRSAVTQTTHWPAAPEPSPREGRARRTRRAGAGGRWWVWAGRALLWAAIVVVVFNGVRAPFVQATRSSHATSGTGDASSRFPTTAASAYALQFASVYLNYDQDRASERASALAAYLPGGTDAQLGWNGSGELHLESAEVAGVDARDANHAVVTLSVRVNGTWMRLAVPVYARGGAMVVAGEPALMPQPPKASLPSAPAQALDGVATQELREQLPGFFQAYAASDGEALTRYLAPGASVGGLSNAVRFTSLDEVVAPRGGATRRVTATVTWQIPTSAQSKDEKALPGELQQTYQLTVTKQDGRWYVEDIRGATLVGAQ